MNVTVEHLAPCRKLMRVEVESQTVDAAFDEVTAQFQRQVQLQGFRPGKAPRDLVIKLFGQKIEQEVKRKLVDDNYRKALRQENLRAVTAPEIEEIQLDKGKPFQFAARIETAPEFTLPEYKGIPVQVPAREVTENDIEGALRVLQDRGASYTTVARPAQPGDFVVINYSGTSEGKPLTDFAPTAKGLTNQKNFWVEIKPDSFIPGFSEQLVAAAAGHKRTVSVEFPADFVTPQLSGRAGVYQVEIVEVKEKVLPPLDDALAKNYGAENLQALRTGVKKDLANELNYKRSREIRSQVITSLLNRVNFELPESALASETRHVVYDIVQENQKRGVSRESIEEKNKEIYNVALSSARDRLRMAFIVGRIAEAENIRVEERELHERIVHMAAQYQIKLDKLIKQLKERNGFAEIHEQILTAKVLDFLEKNARVDEILPDLQPAQP